jgi:hypothetical protein
MVQVVEQSKCETLSSNPSTIKKRKERKKGRRGGREKTLTEN